MVRKKKRLKIKATVKPTLVGEHIAWGQMVCLREGKYFKVSLVTDFPIAVASTEFYEDEEAFLTGPLMNMLSKHEIEVEEDD